MRIDEIVQCPHLRTTGPRAGESPRSATMESRAEPFDQGLAASRCLQRGAPPIRNEFLY